MKPMKPEIIQQKNTSLIVEILKDNPKIKRGNLYKEVMKRQKEKYGKSTTYQVIARDVNRLIKSGIIKVVGGGPKSQVLSLCGG